MKRSKTPVLNMATKAARQGVATSRFTITKEQAQQLRVEERHGGREAGLRFVLKLLAAGTR